MSLVFDKNAFANLIMKAIGERSLNNYARQSGVDAGHLSRLSRGLLDSPPTPKTIEKLASVAHNGVTYEELMKAAGHLGELNLGFGSIYDKKGNTPEITELPDNFPFKVDSRTKKQWKELLEKGGQAFFYNDEVDEEDKKEMLDILTEFFIDAKVKNKVKYGRKKKKENEVKDHGGNTETDNE